MNTKSNRPSQIAVALALSLCALGAQAGFVPVSGVNNEVNVSGFPNPDTLANASIIAARNAFLGGVTLIGGTEYEAGSTNILAGDGSVRGTLSGGATLRNWQSADPTLGRYNTTLGLPTNDFGNWLESNATFQYNFANPISAFAFFGTDFGDFDGGVQIQLLFGGAQVGIFDIDTAPALAPVNGTLSDPDASNGNLVYFGVKGETDLDRFDTVRFIISQADGNDPDTGLPYNDIIGIDSVFIGLRDPGTPGTVPVPSTLLLAGLGLAGLAAGRRRKV